MFGGLVQSTLRGQWREGLKGMGEDFISWAESLFEDWVKSRIFKALSPKGITGGSAGSGGGSGSLWGGIKSLFGFGGGGGGFDIGGGGPGGRGRGGGGGLWGRVG